MSAPVIFLFLLIPATVLLFVMMRIWGEYVVWRGWGIFYAVLPLILVLWGLMVAGVYYDCKDNSIKFFGLHKCYEEVE